MTKVLFVLSFLTFGVQALDHFTYEFPCKTIRKVCSESVVACKDAAITAFVSGTKQKNSSEFPSTLRCLIQSQNFTEESAYTYLINQLLAADGQRILADHRDQPWTCALYWQNNRLELKDPEVKVQKTWQLTESRYQNFQIFLPEFKSYLLEVKSKGLTTGEKIFYVEDRVLEFKMIKSSHYKSIEIIERNQEESYADGFNTSVSFNFNEEGLEAAFGFSLKKKKSGVIEESNILTGQGFISLMHWFTDDVLNSPITRIVDHWYVPYGNSLSDNYLEYKKGLQAGMADLEAAEKTWSAKAYEKLGFKLYDVKEERGFIKVIFVKK